MTVAAAHELVGEPRRGSRDRTPRRSSRSWHRAATTHEDDDPQEHRRPQLHGGLGPRGRVPAGLGLTITVRGSRARPPGAAAPNGTFALARSCSSTSVTPSWFAMASATARDRATSTSIARAAGQLEPERVLPGRARGDPGIGADLGRLPERHLGAGRVDEDPPEPARLARRPRRPSRRARGPGPAGAARAAPPARVPGGRVGHPDRDRERALLVPDADLERERARPEIPREPEQAVVRDARCAPASRSRSPPAPSACGSPGTATPSLAAGPSRQSAYSVNTGTPLGSHQWQLPHTIAWACSGEQPMRWK